MPSERPIKLTIAALGGQGGGVLANWLVEIAESEGYLAQTTSVPGVAQRTGATIYYLEFFPKKVAVEVGRDPIMALMPVPGDVDCVLASELAEAARAIQRGLVTRDRTTVIASTHRSYAIGEKSAMGDGTADEEQLLELVRTQPKRSVLLDMDAVAERHHSVISSVMLGALGGSGVLPFRKAAFEAAIKKGGIAVDTNLAAFEDAYARAERGGDDMVSGAGDPSAVQAAGDGQGATGELCAVPERARSPELQPLLDRVRRLAEPVQRVVLEGVRRAIDYQDPRYAGLYLDRVERLAALDARRVGDDGSGSAGAGGRASSRGSAGARSSDGAGTSGSAGLCGSAGAGGSVGAGGSAGIGGSAGVGDRAGAGNSAHSTPARPGAAEAAGRDDGYAPWSLTEATARSLALWMTFEDTIRVADLKTRVRRFGRVREEIRAEPGQLFGITEFMKPRVEEIAGTMPVGMGRWVLRSPRVSRWLSRWTGGKEIRTGTIRGFLLLHTLGGLKRWRRGTLRYQEENARIERWLGQIEGLAATNYPLAVELARAQRLVKGYGETHERGWRNFSSLVERIDELATRQDGAAVFARLQLAALADEEGKALARELAEISSVAVVKAALERARA
jgi:indolepyruvate ferredoxin oxidoreductase beta subunit